MNEMKKHFIQLLSSLIGVMLFLIVLSMLLANRLEAAEVDAVPVPVSVNALMVTLVDHSAHYIWDYGAMERPITDEEWRMVEYYAIQLAGAGPLINLGGSGPLDSSWAASPQWAGFARDMSNAAMEALDASKERNQKKLLSVGDDLILSCTNCHDAFKPEVPTEGLTHMPDYDYLYHLFRPEQD